MRRRRRRRRRRRCRWITIISLAWLACFITDTECCKKQRNNTWWWKTPYIMAGMDEAEGRKEGRRRYQRSERQTDLQLRTEQAPSSPSKRTF
jgi:hypothetical protein